MNPVDSRMPGTDEAELVTVNRRVVLFQVRLEDPPNPPELLNCTSVSAPPGEPLPPPRDTQADPLNTCWALAVSSQYCAPALNVSEAVSAGTPALWPVCT